MRMNEASNGHKKARDYQKHGHYSRKRALKDRGLRAIDLRTNDGKAVFTTMEALHSISWAPTKANPGR
jgi:hypothetical protein